jgi:hypothetical protein
MAANENVVQEWRFNIGEAFPADDPVARFTVAVAGVLNDNLLSHTLFVESNEPFRLLYFFNLASSHLYEASETLLRARNEWREVREFVDALDQERRGEFERVVALADQNPPWPGQRLKDIRNSFFHYLRLDRAAYDAGRLPLALGLQTAADLDSSLVSEPGGPLSGIRAKFADQAAISAITSDYEDGEYERLIVALADYQGDLNRFAQAVVGRYIRELSDGIVTHETREVVDGAESDEAAG